MKRIFLSTISLICLSLLLGREAAADEPCGGSGGGDASAGGGEKTLAPDELTYYTPGQGNAKMEGGCKSSTPGYDACQGRIDDAATGKKPFVVTATQQKGKSSEFFGCWARSEELSQKVQAQKPLCFAMVDHYAGSENEGKTSKYNHKKIGSKFDIASDRKGKYGKMVAAAKGSKFTCVGRVPGVGAKRKVSRNPKAT